jgi:hypothetical protein
VILTHVWMLLVDYQHEVLVHGAFVTHTGVVAEARKTMSHYPGEWAMTPTGCLDDQRPAFEYAETWTNPATSVVVRIYRFPIRDDVLDLLAHVGKKP